MSKFLGRLYAPCLFVLLVCNQICAQTATATLSGTIQDQNAAVIPGVVVSVRNDAQGFERNVTTNESGYFTIPFLPPGTYTLTATREGFAVARVSEVDLNVGDQKALNVALKIGDVKSEVVVTPEAGLVSTSPAVSTTIDETFVRELPLSGRSFQSLILLTPGVVLTDASSPYAPGGFSVNGQRSNANYLTVDGVSANIAVGAGFDYSISQQQAGTLPGFSALGTTGNLVSVDALQEFKIQTSTYSAESGRQPGGQIQIVTRAGGSDFHGSLFEYLRNEAFDANDWFANRDGLPKAALRQNQFGGTFSGPVVLPRFGEGNSPFWVGRKGTFFFFSYEGLRMLLPVSDPGYIPLVPSLRIRQLAPDAIKPLLNMFPLPTGPEIESSPGVPLGLSPFRENFSSPKSLDASSVRIDHTLSKSVSIFGRYNESPSESLTRNMSFLYGFKNRTRTLTLGSAQVLTKNLSNEIRFNYSTNRGQNSNSMDNLGGAVPVEPSLLYSGYSGAGIKQGSFRFLVEGIAPFLGDSSDSYQRQVNIVDNLSVLAGNHQMRFGIDYRRLAPIYGPVAYSQSIFFLTEADLLAGRVTSLSRSTNRGARPLFDNFSAYAQDTWKMTDRLTLDLGVRWELNPSPGEADGRKPVLVQGVENISTATLAPPETPIFNTIYTAFAPRFGISYLLRRKSGSETIFRGGVGVYYDLGNSQGSGAFSVFPFSAGQGLSNVPYPLPSALVGPPPFPSASLPIDTTLYGLNPDLKLPYTLQWNIALSQSLGQNQTVSLSYVAAVGRNLLTSQLLNERSGNLNTNTGPRPNPNLGLVRYVSNGPTSDYHSMQAQYQRRLSRGIQALVNYTWSRAIDEVSNEAEPGTLEKGDADFDVRHNFSAAVTYNFPNLGRGRFLSAILNGWSLNTIAFVQTGQPINLSVGTLSRGDSTQINVRPDWIPGIPIWVEDATVAGGRRINRAAFALPPRVSGVFQRQGTLGRNVVRLPMRHQINASVRREIRFSEKFYVQLRADIFNVANHPLFGSYVSSTRLGTARFGRAESMLNRSLGGLDPLYQLGGPRSMQFSVRLGF